MTRKLMLGAVLAGLVVFLWSGFSHMVLPWWNANTNSFTNSEALSAVMLAGADGDGIYMLPSAEPPTTEAESERMRGGPVAFVALTTGGMDPASPRAFVLQLIFDIVIALFLARLLTCIGDQAFSVRLRLVVLVALLAGMMVHLPYWAWYGFAGGFTLVSMIDLVIGWFLGGLVLARFAK